MDKLVLDTIKEKLFNVLRKAGEVSATVETVRIQEANAIAELRDCAVEVQALKQHLADAGYDAQGIERAAEEAAKEAALGVDFLKHGPGRAAFLAFKTPLQEFLAREEVASPPNDRLIWGISASSCVSVPVAAPVLTSDANFEEADHAFVESILPRDWTPEGCAATWRGLIPEGEQISPAPVPTPPPGLPTMFAVWGIEYDRMARLTVEGRSGWLVIAGFLQAGVRLKPLRALRHALRLAIGAAGPGPIKFDLLHGDVPRGAVTDRGFWQANLRIPFGAR